MARNQERMSTKRDNHGRFHDEEYDHYQYRDGFGRSTRNDRDMSFDRNPRGNQGQLRDEEYDHYQYRDGYGRSTNNDREMKRNRGEYFTSEDRNRYGYHSGRGQSTEYDIDAHRNFSNRGNRNHERENEISYNLGNGTSMRRNSDHDDFTRRDQSNPVSDRQNFASDYGHSEDRGHFGKGPKGWRRSDDRIKDEVCEVLNDSYTVDASDIDVNVKDGFVTLSGNVDARETKLEAERCAERVRGVQDVHNELRIKRNENVSDFGKAGRLS